MGGSRGCWPGGKEGAEAAGCTLSPEGRGRKSSVGRRRPQGRLMWPHVVSRILRRSGGAPGGHLHLAAKWTWLGVPWGSVRWSPISTRWVLGPVTLLPTLWQQEFVYLEWHIFQVWPEDIVLHALNWLTDSSALAGRERKCVSLMWPISLCSLTSVSDTIVMQVSLELNTVVTLCLNIIPAKRMQKQCE